MDAKQASHFINRQRVQAWTHKLYLEMANLLYQHRLSLTPPVIQILPLSDRWGAWDPLTRTITIAHQLIVDYSWAAVLEILKHEIAHVIVNEEFGSDQIHGPLFHLACNRLGIADWARRAESEPIDMSPQSSPDEERLLNRAEKLLALATSSNEHEAFLAMNKVRELYAKYNLDRLQSKRKSPHVQVSLNFKKRRIERYETAIASLLQEFYFVEVIHSSLYDPDTQVDHKTLELLGTVQNVKIAEYVFHFVRNQLPLLWRAFKNEYKSMARQHQTTYYLGVVSGLRERLEQKRALDDNSDSKALAVMKDPELEEYLRTRFPRTRKKTNASRFQHPEVHAAGREAGSKLIIHKGIHEHAGNQKKLLR